ncbi:hypothetical protein BG452_17520 [Streptomyces sp. CBMA123]|nr:hypothetical protein [Streptomyces sp. CBMA123]
MPSESSRAITSRIGSSCQNGRFLRAGFAGASGDPGASEGSGVSDDPPFAAASGVAPASAAPSGPVPGLSSDPPLSPDSVLCCTLM